MPQTPFLFSSTTSTQNEQRNYESIILFRTWSGGSLRIGHVDGKDKIYDLEGELILSPGETLLSRHGNVTMNVTKPWRGFYMNSVYAREAGPFRCFMTDQRVVFIRRPNPIRAGAYLMTPYGAPEGIAKTYKARMILAEGGFEYYELQIHDIRFYRAYRKCIVLFIAGNEQKHRAVVSNGGAKPAIREPRLSMVKSIGIPPR